MHSAKDRLRHALQSPIAAPKYCVLHMRDGDQQRTPWLYRREHATAALQIVRRKFGEAIIYAD